MRGASLLPTQSISGSKRGSMIGRGHAARHGDYSINKSNPACKQMDLCVIKPACDTPQRRSVLPQEAKAWILACESSRTPQPASRAWRPPGASARSASMPTSTGATSRTHTLLLDSGGKGCRCTNTCTSSCRIDVCAHARANQCTCKRSCESMYM